MHVQKFGAVFAGLVAAALTLMTGCTSQGGQVTASPAASPQAEVHWEYEGADGPAARSTLSPDFATCAAGKSQSPIDISRAGPRDLPNITFDYKPADLNIVNNGHTIQANYQPGSSIVVDGARYDLLQFHFHHPSEHTLDGAQLDLELHLVHRGADQKLAVVGVLIKGGASDNAAFKPIWDNLPAQRGDERKAAADALDLLPTDRTFYTYAGSLTTPPCTEGVTWLVLKAPIELSQAQIEAFKAIFELNARPVQPLNQRALLLDSSP
jgi:carbonic anhydrase